MIAPLNSYYNYTLNDLEEKSMLRNLIVDFTKVHYNIAQINSFLFNMVKKGGILRPFLYYFLIPSSAMIARYLSISVLIK